jgi:hypothetical protein
VLARAVRRLADVRSLGRGVLDDQRLLPGAHVPALRHDLRARQHRRPVHRQRRLPHEPDLQWVVVHEALRGRLGLWRDELLHLGHDGGADVLPGVRDGRQRRLRDLPRHELHHGLGPDRPDAASLLGVASASPVVPIVPDSRAWRRGRISAFFGVRQGVSGGGGRMRPRRRAPEANFAAPETRDHTVRQQPIGRSIAALSSGGKCFLTQCRKIVRILSLWKPLGGAKCALGVPHEAAMPELSRLLLSCPESSW